MTIFYTGIGSNDDGLHTEQEFLDIMKKQFVERDFYEHKEWLKCIQNEGKLMKKELPQDFKTFTLEDWLKFTGASYKITFDLNNFQYDEEYTFVDLDYEDITN